MCGMSDWLTAPLVTARLRLRAWTAGDQPYFVALKTDAEVRAFLGGPVPCERAVARTGEQIAQDRWGYFVLADAEAGTPLGTITFDRKRGPCEISFQLQRGCWGQGLMGETVTAVSAWFFDNSQDDEFIAVTQAQNRRSRALLEPAGVELTGEFFQYGAAQMLYRVRRSQPAT